MRFEIKLQAFKGNEIPINYQYPLSAAIYKILAKGDADYASFLHEEGYGKGYKLFTFSDLKFKFKLVKGDRMQLLDDLVSFYVHFHIPEASGNFVMGLFKSEEIVIADKKSKTIFKVQSVISNNTPWSKGIDKNEIIQTVFKPTSAVLMGVKNDRGHYDYLEPKDERYIEALVFNWRGKIKETYDKFTAKNAILNAEIEYYENPYRSRLVHIKQDSKQATKVRGYVNFKIKLIAERRFVELLYNAGVGIGNAQGMGCCEVISYRSFNE